MPNERLLTWILGRDAGARDSALRGLLSALWSFLQHSPASLEVHLTALEERLRGLEMRLVGDFRTTVNTGVVAVEETVADVEHRLEDDVERVIHGRVVRIQARLETVKKRVVEDLKYELRRVALMLVLASGCALLALVAVIFGLMAAWTDLERFIGAVSASLILAVVFLVASLVMVGLLRSVLHRSQPPSGVSKVVI
jgi:Putative Actinobacterial Holin-X, holin superfamily III